MGMRVVSLTEEVFAINSELHVFGKARVVGGKILDKLLIVDRKHKIRDKLASTMQWIFGKVSNAANQVKNDMQAQTEIE